MQINLNTTLVAYPKLSKPLLDNYVTKEELEAKDYVTHTELAEILAEYVKEVVNPVPSVVYGRRLVNGIMTWVPISEVPAANQLLCYGMIDSGTMDSSKIETLNRAALDDSQTEYLMEYQLVEPGYFWFCCSRPLGDIVVANGLTYNIDAVEQPELVPVVVDTKTFNMHCYRTTSKVAALGNLTCKFNVQIN